jgi:hypothetical protein
VDKATLVRSDLEIEGRILGALSRAKIPVTLCDLNYVEPLQEWQLVIATPWYDSRGPRVSYDRVFRAMQEAGIYEEAPIRRIFLRSPNDPLVRALERDVKQRTEGAVHILADRRTAHQKNFAVIFAPFVGPGGSVPARHLTGIDNLRAFLEDELYISHSSVDEALRDIERKGSASIFNVQLTRKELRKLSLA